MKHIQSLGIAMQGWYPLEGRGYTEKLLNHKTLCGIAAAYGSKQEEKSAGNTGAETSASTQPEENVDQEESTEPKEEESSEGTSAEQTGDGKTLVVYFSMPETTNPDNMNAEEEYSTVVIDGEVLGNTQYVAYVIQENTGADIFRIEPVTHRYMNPKCSLISSFAVIVTGIFQQLL